MLHRIVDLVTRLSLMCRNADSFREIAEAASEILGGLFPDTSVMVFEHHAASGMVRVVAGARVPVAWSMRAAPLADVPLLAEAYASSQRVLRSSALSRRSVEAGSPLPAGSLEVLCAAVPDPGESVYALMLFAPPNAQETAEREAAIEVARRMLAASPVSRDGNGERLRTIAAIVDAKREWQLTADALPQIVGIIDRRRRVVRVNRAVERWGLGGLRSVLRRDPHGLLHPGCADAGCGLRRELDTAVAALAEGRTAAFEIHDAVTDKDLTVQLQPATPAPDEPASVRTFASFVIADVTPLRQAKRDLQALNQVLEDRVTQRTEELTHANRSLRDEVTRRGVVERDLLQSQRALEALSERLVNAQEQERQRIAQDLHDSIGQSLGAVKYSLERAQVLARRQELGEAISAIEATISRIQRIMVEVRGISMNLRPAVLDDLGAVSAVRFLCREWRDVYQDVALATDIEVADNEIPAALGTSVFRSVQELLNNVARHAHANHVEVSMRIADATLQVAVRDDGVGFALNGDIRRLIDHPELRGLRGLRERASQAGGRCDVSSAPGRGTLVRLEWPITGARAAREASTYVN